MVSGEHLKRAVGIEHHHDRRFSVESTVAVDMGIGKVNVIPCRATEMGQPAERRIQGHQKAFFIRGEAINQGKNKSVAVDRGLQATLALLNQGADTQLRRLEIETFEGNPPAADLEVPAGEPQRTDTTFGVAEGVISPAVVHPITSQRVKA